VAELGVKALVGRENAVVAEQPGVAVRCAPGHELRGDIAARARPVLDHDLLAPGFGELLAEGAREDIARPARGEADDEAHGFSRPALGERAGAGKADAANQGGKDALHGLLSR